jgi:arylsulfatase A-like enzyme/Flp pilus assembly protein TadD
MSRSRAVRARAAALLSGAVLLTSALPACDSSPRAAGKLNCLIITVDTLRADRLSAYGAKSVRTPAIDGLAAEGVLFSRAFAHSVTTLPSHANIMLGAPPQYHGVHDNANFVVPAGIPSLAEVFKQAGYATAAFIGAYPLDRRFGLDRGFDVYDDDYGVQDFGRPDFVERPAAAVADRAKEWLGKTSGPWLLWVHLFDPHYPYAPPEPFASSYRDHPYDGEVAYVDEVLGGLFALLRESGAFGNTLIILTSDHGESLGEHGEKTHGYFAYNATLHVPLIIRAPGAAAGRAVAAVVSHLDIFPTVCDVTGLEKPAHVRGRSLLPALKGRRIPDEKVLFESMYPYYSRGWAPLTGYIDFPAKFIESPIPELYDLGSDPAEARNLAAGEDLSAHRAKMAALIRAAAGPESAAARARAPEGASLEKLRSLGYVSGAAPAPGKEFGPADDIKSFMPFENRAAEAMDRFRAGGSAEEAAAALLANIREKKDHDISYTYLASLYLELGRPAEAVRVLRQGMENIPGNYTIFLAYVSAMLSLGEYGEVVNLLGRARYFQAENDPEIWNSLGVAHAGLGRLDDALAFYEKALALDPDFPAALTNMGAALLMKARAAGDRAMLDRAVESFKQAIARKPTHAAAYNGLGAAYKTAGDTDAAISCWLEAVRLDPGLDLPLYNLGFAYLEKGEKARALEFLLKYRERAYNSLPPDEKARLDELIRRAR